MSQPRIAALFLAVLAAGTAVLVTIVALLVQFRGGADQAEVWRSLVVALGGVGIALSVIGLVHLSFIAARNATGARRAALVADWLQVWSAVASGARSPSVIGEQRAAASEAAAAVLQELTGEGAARVRQALRASGVIDAELRLAGSGVASGGRPATEALERLAWIAVPEALPLFAGAVGRSPRASRAALLGAMRILALKSRPDETARRIVTMIERALASAKDPYGARPFLSAVLLSSGDNLGRMCTLLMEPGRHEVARLAAIEAICRSHRPEAGELAGRVLQLGAQGETKAAALKGLARIGHVPLAAARAVLAATEDPSIAVRVNAAHALAGIDARLALAALWHSLADPVWDVRLAASDTLLRFGDAGEEVLQRAARGHDDRFARDIAGMALGLSSAAALGITPDDLLDVGSLTSLRTARSASGAEAGA